MLRTLLRYANLSHHYLIGRLPSHPTGHLLIVKTRCLTRVTRLHLNRNVGALPVPLTGLDWISSTTIITASTPVLSVLRSGLPDFAVAIVSSAFEGKTQIARHRLVNSLLKDEFDAGLHALSLRLKTPKEWEKTDEAQPAA